MMYEFVLLVSAALWLGILTSISPCPLATNVAAIAFIGKNSKKKNKVLAGGLLYTLGRMLVYFVLAILISKSLNQIPAVSAFLQQNMNKILGPLLILVGMVLSRLITLPTFNGIANDRLQNLVSRFNLAGAFLLGVLFALSFCPVSAALYFGSLIPLVVANDSSFILALFYGIGTALPVIIFAFVIAFSANLLGKYFKVISKIEQHARMITGVLFIIAGIYYVLRFIFDIL